MAGTTEKNSPIVNQATPTDTTTEESSEETVQLAQAAAAAQVASPGRGAGKARPRCRRRRRVNHFSGRWAKTLRRLSIVVCPLLVGACALPLPLQIAMWATDGISYLTTSKSMSDHGLSAAVGRDCAVHRAVTEGAICTGDEDSGKLLASSKDDSGTSGAPQTPLSAEIRDPSIHIDRAGRGRTREDPPTS